MRHRVDAPLWNLFIGYDGVSSSNGVRRRNPALTFFVWGLFSFCSLPVIFHFQKEYFAKREPFFICPIPSQYNLAHLRSDGYGKGYFGASRRGGRIHQGIDLLSAVGEPVFAAKSGRVLYAGWNNKGYGRYIEIVHPDGLKTIYAHLSKIDIESKFWVRQGETIGKIGKTGNAKNHNILPHLHFELRNHNKPIDPIPFISYKIS